MFPTKMPSCKRIHGSVRISLLAIGSVVVSLAVFVKFFDFFHPNRGTQKTKPLLIINIQQPAKGEAVLNESSFAACMVWKDDNHILIEWLAYHYQRLPLRRLIIGVDRFANFDVSPVAERYNSRGLMNITVWHDQDYMNEHLLARFDLSNMSGDDHLALHRSRQREVYRHCMLQLMSEETKWTWTTFIDTDEFVAFNHYVHPKASAMYPAINNMSGRSSDWTWFEWLQQAATSNYRFSLFSKPCFMIPRVIYGSRVDNGTLGDNQTDSLSLFDTQRFSTYRFKYTSGPEQRTGMHKSIIDLQHVQKLQPNISNALASNLTVEIHNTLPDFCPRKELFEPIPFFPIRLNHYLGSREQYFFREDFRADIGVARTERKYRRKNGMSSKYFDTSHDSFMVGWLDDFVANVGIDVAQELLEGVGELKSAE